MTASDFYEPKSGVSIPWIFTRNGHKFYISSTLCDLPHCLYFEFTSTETKQVGIYFHGRKKLPWKLFFFHFNSIEVILASIEVKYTSMKLGFTSMEVNQGFQGTFHQLPWKMYFFKGWIYFPFGTLFPPRTVVI